MDRGFLIGTGIASALTFAGVLFLTAPAASTNPATPPPAALPAMAPAPDIDLPREEASEIAPPGAYYPNCSAARAAGVAPIYRGQPGYRSAMDADSDGIACEPYRGGSDGFRVPRRVRW